jgi:hypothetical protein
MSPECRWNEVPKEIKDGVRSTLDKKGDKSFKKELARLLNSRDGFFIIERPEAVGEDAISLGRPLNQLYEVVEADILDTDQLNKNCQRAKTDPRFYHVISLNNTTRAVHVRDAINKIYEDVTPENVDPCGGHGSKFRGKHRSHNKGAGINALFRSMGKHREK